MLRPSRSAALPLFWRLGRVALLADDPAVLRLARSPLSRKWSTRFYSAAGEFAGALKAEIPSWESDASSQQDVVRAWRAGNSSLPAEVVRYWTRSSHAFTRIALVDQLTAAAGVETLRDLRADGWGGFAVLLSGLADDQVIISAFNERLIERYERNTPPLFPRLGELVSELQQAPDPRLDQIWRSTLRPEQDAVLRLPDVARPLGKYLRARMAQYVVIGDPFGVLGLSADGQIVWAPLRLVSSSSTQWFDDVEMRQALSIGGQPAEPAEGMRFGPGGQLAAMCFPLAQEAVPAIARRQQSWLDLQGSAAATTKAFQH